MLKPWTHDGATVRHSGSAKVTVQGGSICDDHAAKGIGFIRPPRCRIIAIHVAGDVCIVCESHLTRGAEPDGGCRPSTA
jgi:hypothetical protein